MGAVADAALAGRGRAVGVMPQGLVDREIAHRGLSELIVTPDMHARKARMARLADAFLALPGGYGTLDELFEAVTWGSWDCTASRWACWTAGGSGTGCGASWPRPGRGSSPNPGLAELPCAEDPDRILDLLVEQAGTLNV